MIIDSPIISGSYSASGSLNQFGNVVITGSLTVTGSIIGTASFASTASYLSGYVSPFPFTGSATISGSLDVTGSLKVTGSITSTGTLTAQTLVVQTVSSSTVYSSGSNIFGNKATDNQVFTGSLLVSGSITVSGSVINNLTASYAVSASQAISSSFSATASYALNAGNIDTGSLVTTSSFYAYTASLNAFSASINSYTASNNTTVANFQSATASLNAATASLNLFTASINSYTASNNANITSLNLATASLNSYTSSINAKTGSFATTGSNIFTADQTIQGTLTVNRIVVQTVTASQTYSSGSNIFGNSLANTQTFTGSVNITGSNHSIFGNVGIGITGSSAYGLDVSGSARVSGNCTINGTLTGVTQYDTSGGHYMQLVSTTSTNGYVNFRRGGGINGLTAYQLSNHGSGPSAQLSYDSGTGETLLTTTQFLSFATNSTTGMQMFRTTRNVVLQDGGTFTDAGFRLDVSGSARLNGNTQVTGSLVVSGSITTTGTITAQTLVVQTVTSSVIYSSGSNVFGNSLANTQVLTGSVSITGSLAVNGSNAILTNQTSSMSASYAANATSASSAISSSFANTAGSLVTTSNYQMASLGVGTAPVAPFKGNFYGQVIVQNGINNATGQQSLIFAYPGITNNLTHSIWSGHDASVANYNKLDFYISKTDGTTKNVLSLRSSQPVLIGSDTGLGLTVSGSTVISGSLTSTTGITGSLLGTSSFANTATSASYALTASYSANVPVTASYANNANSASYALSSSFATTASYLSGYVSPFPFTGSAIISGSLTVTGSVAVSNLSGSGVRYLVADSSGSITAQSASAALKSTEAFTSTAGQTTFAVTNGYSTGYVDVFINGSKLATAEFTDTSGTNIVLATGSFSGDTVEVVKYTPAAGVTNNVLRQLTTFTGSAGQTVFSASYTPGLLDIFYNGSRLSPSDYTANNGTFFTLATGSAANDILDVLVYSYQVGAFSGIGGQGVTNQLSFFNATSSISGSTNLTYNGSTLTLIGNKVITGSVFISGSKTIIGTNTITGSLFVTGSQTFIGTKTITGSVFITGSKTVIGNNTVSGSMSISGSLDVNGPITATTLIVQTITASTEYSSGSNVFGNSLANTQTFTGSVSMNPNGLFVSSSGNVGIGNIVPSYNLDVTGTGRFTSNVGIGSVLSTWGSPFNNAVLQLGTGGGFIVGRNDAFNQLQIGSNATYDGTNWLYKSTDYASKYYQAQGTHLFQYAPSGTAGATITWNTALTLASTGAATFSSSVSLGGYLTGQGTNPGGLGGSRYVLDWLSGYMRIFSYGADTSTNGGFVLNSQRSNGTNSIDVLTIASTGASTFTSTNSALNVVAITSPSTSGYVQLQLQSNSSGNTAYGGLNVISSTGKAGYLTCGDNSFAAGNYFAQASYVTLAGTLGAAMKFRVNADDNAGITISTGGTITFNAYGAGSLSTNSSGVISASDGRYKTKTRSITNALDAIMQLNPTYYRWNKDSEFHTEYEELGFIAQEVASVIPAASPEPEQENKYKNYHDRAIIAVLTKAVQELQEKLERNNIN